MFPRIKTLIAAACLLAAAVSARATNLAPYTSATSTGSANFAWSAGAGGPYTAVISDTNTFITYISSNNNVASTSIGYPGLVKDVTYYFKVRRTAELESEYAQTSTATWASAPSGIFSAPVFFSAYAPYSATASIGWNVNGNPEWTNYELAFADNASFTGQTVRQYISPHGAPLAVGGLDANSVYYFKVRTRAASGTISAYTPYISTATLSIVPDNIAGSVFESSAAVSWVPVDGTGAESSEGYRLIVSTSELLDPLVINWSTPDDTLASTATAAGSLNRNTTYYYKMGSLNVAGEPNYDEMRYFTTLAAKPANLARLAMTDAEATLGWTALPPGAGSNSALGYRLEASTTNFNGTGVLHSSVSYGVALSTLTITTLEANTTYYLRTSSLNLAYNPNHTASVSSITLALPLDPHPSLTAVYPDAQYMLIDFTPLEVTPQAFSCQGYRVEATTGTFGGTAPVFSSTTYDNQAEFLRIEGLAPNNVYQLRIATLNWERTPNYTSLTSTRTHIPGYLQNVTLDHVWSSSAVVSFDSGIANEGHVAQASPDRFFESQNITVTTPNTAATTMNIIGLDPNTTYYYRVGALYNGATVYTNTTPDMRQTLPVRVTGVNVSSVFYSSVTASWTPLSQASQLLDANSYLLEVAATPAFSTVLSSSRTFEIPLGSLTISGLAPNTTYYFRHGSVNEQGYANYTAVHSTATLANPPTPQAFGLTPASINLTWLANSNPADTLYYVEMADNPGYAPAEVSSTTALSSATFSGLAPNTIYYSRVTAINRMQRRTPVVNFSPMATGAHHPAAAATTGVGVTGLTANWTEGGNTPLITSYQAQISSSSDFSGLMLSSVTKNLYASFEGLVSDASYYLRVSALNLSGVPTDPPVSLGNALTLPATAYILPWQDTFSGLLTDGFTLNWASNGNSSHTVYQVQASTAPDFSVINSSIAAQGLACSFADLQVYTTYWVRLRAMGQSGVLSAFEEAGSTRTLLSSQMNVSAQLNNLITLETSYGTISVLVPRGAIGGATRLTIMPSTFTLPGPQSAVAELTPTGIGLIVNYFPPTLVLNTITITLPYRIADLPAAMQSDRSKLILALYDEVHGIWVPLPSVSDTANNQVIAQTWHLSTFQIMQTQPAAALSNVKIYPNPYRTNSVSDVMHFINMPPLAKVKIYTFVGELVREIRADVNGMAHWDGLNDAGRKVASGVYIAFIQSRDKRSQKSFKVAIER